MNVDPNALIQSVGQQMGAAHGQQFAAALAELAIAKAQIQSLTAALEAVRDAGEKGEG